MVAYTVALVGFSQAESSTFESFLRLAARRPPGYRVQDEVIDAQILVVNADNAQALHLVRYADLPGKVLLVGNTDGGTGWPLQRKPVRLVSVLAALDGIVGVTSASAPAKKRSGNSGYQPAEPYQASQLQGLDASMRRAGSRRGADTEFPPTRPMLRETAPAPAQTPRTAARPPAAAARAGVMRMTDFGGLDDLPSPPAPAAKSTRAPRSRLSADKNATAMAELPRGDMLLVAESLVEGRILLKRFKKYGLSVDWSREAPQALVMLKAHHYRLVVIDRLKGEPDAYQICRSAKQTKGPKGAPVVIMFAPTAGSMDRMKAGLAGSDAYLSRSITEAELYKVLAQHRMVSLDGFAPTNVGF
jgi:CheY-like chemotaxis protein